MVDRPQNVVKAEFATEIPLHNEFRHIRGAAQQTQVPSTEFCRQKPDKNVVW